MLLHIFHLGKAILNFKMQIQPAAAIKLSFQARSWIKANKKALQFLKSSRMPKRHKETQVDRLTSLLDELSGQKRLTGMVNQKNFYLSKTKHRHQV